MVHLLARLVLEGCWEDIVGSFVSKISFGGMLGGYGRRGLE